MANKKRSPIAEDPTRTATIRKNWVADAKRRHKELAQRAVDFTLAELQPISRQAVQNKARFEYTYDQNRINAFLVWLQIQVDDLLLTGGADNSWQNAYLEEAYLRGIKSAQAKTNQEIRLGELPAEGTPTIEGDLVITGGLSTAAGLSASAEAIIALAIHQEALNVLFTRDFAALKGVTETMSQQIAKVLADGMLEGVGIKELARRIADRVEKIGFARAKLIARTETIRAHQLGVINQGLQLEQQTGVKVRYLWITSADTRVRHTHATRNRKVYTKKAVIPLLGEPNCRCALRLFFPVTDTPERQKARTKIRKEGLTLIDE